jgi:hypothetical protein
VRRRIAVHDGALDRRAAAIDGEKAHIPSWRWNTNTSSARMKPKDLLTPCGQPRICPAGPA